MSSLFDAVIQSELGSGPARENFQSDNLPSSRRSESNGPMSDMNAFPDDRSLELLISSQPISKPICPGPPTCDR